ncbi:MAG: radical SAM protein [Candidatus Omnitrophica bacterium]|nr:radical SAM protein [Candidatus Omnitrophota bacterium]
MRIERHIRKRVHFKRRRDFYKYKIGDFFYGLRYYWQEYLVSAGILKNSVFTGPTLVQIDLTNKCNSKCLVCWQRSPYLGELRATGEWENQEISFTRIISLLRELKKMGTKKIFFSGGGEPLMYPRFWKVISYAKKMGFVCILSSNFTLVDREKAKIFIDLNFDHINVSLWAATPETYMRVHLGRDKECFYRTKDILRFIYEHKKIKHLPHMNIYNVIFKENFYEVDKMVELAFEVGADSIQFVPMDPVVGKTDFLLLNYREREIVKEKLKMIKQKLLDDNPENKRGPNLFICDYEDFLRRLSNEKADKGEYDSLVKDIPCYIGWDFMRITANGDVYPCLKVNVPVGNIYEEDLLKIWYGEKQRIFRKLAKEKKENTYFSPQRCSLSCDNLAQNIILQKQIVSLSKLDKMFMYFLNYYVFSEKIY